jgi:hypothetical protein
MSNFKTHDWRIEGEPNTGGQHVGISAVRYKCIKCNYTTEYGRSTFTIKNSKEIPICNVESVLVEPPCCDYSKGIIKRQNKFFFMEILSYCGEFKCDRVLKQYISYCPFCGKGLK